MRETDLDHSLFPIQTVSLQSVTATYFLTVSSLHSFCLTDFCSVVRKQRKTPFFHVEFEEYFSQFLNGDPATHSPFDVVCLMFKKRDNHYGAVEGKDHIVRLGIVVIGKAFD